MASKQPAGVAEWFVALKLDFMFVGFTIWFLEFFIPEVPRSLGTLFVFLFAGSHLLDRYQRWSSHA